MARGNPACPQASRHAHHPQGYVAHSEWADEVALTHDQERCPGCDLWVIWTPKPCQPVGEVTGDG